MLSAIAFRLCFVFSVRCVMIAAATVIVTTVRAHPIACSLFLTFCSLCAFYCIATVIATTARSQLFPVPYFWYLFVMC